MQIEPTSVGSPRRLPGTDTMKTPDDIAAMRRLHARGSSPPRAQVPRRDRKGALRGKPWFPLPSLDQTPADASASNAR